MGAQKKEFPLTTSRTAWARTCVDDCLIRYPDAPDITACLMYSGSGCAERISTLVMGEVSSICRVASSPFSNGMAISMTITWG